MIHRVRLTWFFLLVFFLKEIQLFYMYFKCWATNSCFHLTLIAKKRISGVMVGVDRGFEPRSGQTKDHNIYICYFSAKYVALSRKSKDWLARNWDNVSE